MTNKENRKEWWILALDGGGIRGLATTVVLERLEEKLQQNNPDARLKDYFQMVAGSSTGSIIACGIAMGKSATELKNLYIENAATIFADRKYYSWLKNSWLAIQKCLFPYKKPSFPIKKWMLPNYYFEPIYDGRGLERVLRQNTIDDRKEISFQELEIPTLITSYDIYNRQAVIFKNTKPEHYNILAWETCRASSAAPILFPAYVIKDFNFLNDWERNGNKIPQQGIPLIDGGIFASDPALCAIAERLKLNEQPPQEDNNPYNKKRFRAIYDKGVAKREYLRRFLRHWAAQFL